LAEEAAGADPFRASSAFNGDPWNTTLDPCVNMLLPSDSSASSSDTLPQRGLRVSIG